MPRDLETACLKCLAKDPSKRYPRARDLADDLNRYLAGQPIRARRTPPWERAAMWSRRHSTASTLIVLAAVAVATASGAGLRYNSLARDRERRETLRVADVRAKVDQSMFEGQDLLAREKWPDAKLVLSNVLTELRGEPRLAADRERAAALLERVDSGSRRQGLREGERRRFEEFLRLRGEALFHSTQFSGLDLPANLDRTRRSIRAALAVFPAPTGTGGWAPESFPESLQEPERSAIRDGTYELLLNLAEAEDRPEDGLTDLGLAARLNPTPSRAYHLRRAACLSRGSDLVSAEAEQKKAEAITPASAFDHFLSGQERYARRDWRTAYRHFDAALRLRPDLFWAHSLAAICSLQLQRPSEAKAELNACLQREPGFAWLYVLRGFASGQVASMARDVSRKVGGRGQSLQLEIDDQMQAAETDYRRAMELLKDRPTDELNYVVRVNHGMLELERGAYDAAAADLREAIRLNDRQFQAFAALAQVYQKQGRPREAREQFGRAVALRPDWAPLYRGRADVTLGDKAATQAERREALADLDRSVRHEAPGSAVLARDHTNRGRLLHLDGRGDEALSACAAAHAVVADYADADLLKIGLLLEMRRYDEVIGSCDAVLARGKASAEIHELRGLARAARRDFAGAIADDTEALALRPGRPPLLIRRGWAYLLANAPGLAMHDFEEAIRIDPSDGDAYNGRGTARGRMGRHRESVKDAEEALRRGGSSSRVAYNAARVYAEAARTAASEVGRTGEDAVSLTNRYQDRAVSLMGEALRRLPPDRRASFWREQVEPDPSLRPIRRRLNRLAPTATLSPTPKSGS